MLDGLVEGLLRGNLLSWAVVAVLWGLLGASVALTTRASRTKSVARPENLPGTASSSPHPLWLLGLLGVTTATSLAGLPLASALAMPRLRYRTVASPDLVRQSGETWRRLRGPAVEVQGSEGRPDIAIPSIDAAGGWVLFGLLSGAPVPGFPPALPGPSDAGMARICPNEPNEAGSCRPWPSSWPDPSRPLILGESAWSRGGAESALAYDVEAGTYLRHLIPPEDGPQAATANADPRPLSSAAFLRWAMPTSMMEIVGRLTTSPPREGTAALFVVRSMTGGQLRAMRVVSTPESGAHNFYMQRAAIDLHAGRQVVRYFARPVLWITAFSLPAGLLFYLVAPLWLAVRRRRDSGRARASLLPSRREAFSRLSPVATGAATFAAGLAAVAPAAVAIASLWTSR